MQGLGLPGHGSWGLIQDEPQGIVLLDIQDSRLEITTLIQNPKLPNTYPY